MTTVTHGPEVTWTGWMRVAQRPSRIARIIERTLERACELSGHAGGCGLLNRSFGFYHGERVIAEFRNPLFGLFVRVFDAASDYRYEAIDLTPPPTTTGTR